MRASITHVPILGPCPDGYKELVRPRFVEPLLDLSLREAENVGAKATTARELPASMPAENGLAAHVQKLGDVTGSEEALAHVLPSVVSSER